MIKITQEKWDKISDSAKGKWEQSIIDNGWQPNLPKEYLGKRTVMSGCISDEIGSLLTEGFHFEII